MEAGRDYVAERYGVVYPSQHSYYDLLEAGGLSYPRREKVNPQRDEAQGRARRAALKKNWRRAGKRLNGRSGVSWGRTKVIWCGALSVGGCGANALPPSQSP